MICMLSVHRIYLRKWLGFHKQKKTSYDYLVFPINCITIKNIGIYVMIFFRFWKKCIGHIGNIYYKIMTSVIFDLFLCCNLVENNQRDLKCSLNISLFYTSYNVNNILGIFNDINYYFIIFEFFFNFYSDKIFLISQKWSTI